MTFVLKELLDTEKEYVEKMNDVIKVGVAGNITHPANVLFMPVGVPSRNVQQ